MLNNIISLVSGCVTFLGGFLVVWGAVSLGLAIREQQGGSQIASAISTIAGGAIIIAASIVDYFARLWREGRKFGLICTGISQNTSHMLLNANARDMVINSDFFLLHKQGPADLEAWTEMLDLSTAERGFIDESIKAGEGLLVAGGIRVPIKDDFPKGELFKLFDTKPAAIAERTMREGPIGGAK